MVYEIAKDACRGDDLEKAAGIYSLLVKATEKAARPYVGLARVAHRKGNLDEALQHLLVAEDRNPHYVPTFVLRGKIFTEQSENEKALEQFTHAIHLSPLNPIRYEEAASIMFDLKLFKEAVTLLSIAVKNELSFPSLHHYLSQANFQLQEYKKAIQHVRIALGSDPENVTYLNQLGVCYKEAGQSQDALKTYNQIIKIDPENKSCLYNKAVLLNSLDKNEEAVKVLKRCIEKHPKFNQAIEKLAEIQSQPTKAS